MREQLLQRKQQPQHSPSKLQLLRHPPHLLLQLLKKHRTTAEEFLRVLLQEKALPKEALTSAKSKDQAQKEEC